jgi:hypothetical protein
VSAWSVLECRARVDGFDLHGRVAFGAAERERLEELVRYCARPPLANDRLNKPR